MEKHKQKGFKDMNNMKDFRADYDYYEDSLGDTYNDYDELYSKADPVEVDSETYETDAEYADDSDSEPKEDMPEIQDAFSQLKGLTTNQNSSRKNDDDEKEYQYSRDDLIALMDKYHNGDETDKKEVRYQFCEMLTPLIKRMIRTSRGVDSEYIDYIQHCYLYICKRLDRFDPRLSFAFNYFKYVIQEAISACHESSYGKSSHEANIDRKVRKQIREFTTMGITPSPSRIASETNLSVLQVEDSLYRIQAEKTVLSEDLTVYERDDGSNLPLDVILKNEISETLLNAIKNLPEMERDAILLSYNFYGTDGPYSNKKIAEVLHVSEIKVKELLISAKRHLKRDFSLDQLLGKSKRISHRTFYFRESDPASFSFNPDSDDFFQLDEDEERSKEVPVNDEDNIYYIEQVDNLTFADY